MVSGESASYSRSEVMRRVGLMGAIGVVLVDILYIWYVEFVQGGLPSDLPWRVPFVAAYLALMAIVAAVSTTVAPGGGPRSSARVAGGFCCSGSWRCSRSGCP